MNTVLAERVTQTWFAPRELTRTRLPGALLSSPAAGLDCPVWSSSNPDDVCAELCAFCQLPVCPTHSLGDAHLLDCTSGPAHTGCHAASCRNELCRASAGH